ncbi:hypothetical protein N7489_004331 [Penicillium chrysogenum]|uniref:uncharacterized protein n=1 Tax=Penicillium chrysogenum TaxID=5076 RepID=UPI0024DF0895|nr:uncharacterized protein N7489_004331 [Penicillium chrysogenum]KAJ5244235.1 hypothetical protein N7489_004331 [Penicillium chrysogenum]
MSDNRSLMVRKFLEDNDSAVVLRQKQTAPDTLKSLKPLHSVDGMACEIVSQTQLDRLEAYETDKTG